MSRKTLKGLIKTRHFKQRQKERQVTDRQIKQAIEIGTFSENDIGQSFTLGHLKVTVDLSHDLLITVHPGDPASKKTKVMDKETAKELKSMIQAAQKNREIPEQQQSDEFLEYVKEFSVKKL